jgi:signal transduction histidine kinase
VARADSGSMELNTKELCLASVVRDVIGEHELNISNKGQTLRAVLNDRLVVQADSEKMKMVVDNLLSNASKYTQPGGAIEVAVTEKAGEACISVKDDGVGIPEDKLAAIFTKFKRVDNELSAPAGGSGLGLYLALKIVKMHGGDITVSSRVGQGSDFRVQLPLTAS